MRITFVSLPGLPYHVAGVPGAHGGAEAQTAVLAGALTAMGHEAVVVVADYDDVARLAPRLTDFPLVNAFNRRDGVPGFRFVHPRWTGLHRAIARARGDVVFQMCAGAGTGQIAFACARTGQAFVFATASDSDVVPGRVRLGFRDRRFYEYGLRRADRVVTQHARQAELLRRNYGISSVPLPLGVELPESLPAPAEPPTVLWLGTFRRVKRPDRWLRLAARFPEARFVMAGGRAASEPDLFDTTRRDAERLANVTFLGPVENTSTVLDGAWTLLNTSDVEGFPTTFLEAWARGIPVTSLFDPDGITARHELGWIAADEEDLARRLATCLGDRAARDAAGTRARAYVEREHAPGVVASRVEAVLREAVERRKGKR